MGIIMPVIHPFSKKYSWVPLLNYLLIEIERELIIYKFLK